MSGESWVAVMARPIAAFSVGTFLFVGVFVINKRCHIIAVDAGWAVIGIAKICWKLVLKIIC